jgi:hypothetical protein
LPRTGAQDNVSDGEQGRIDVREGHELAGLDATGRGMTPRLERVLESW